MMKPPYLVSCDERIDNPLQLLRIPHNPAHENQVMAARAREIDMVNESVFYDMPKKSKLMQLQYLRQKAERLKQKEIERKRFCGLMSEDDGGDTSQYGTSRHYISIEEVPEHLRTPQVIHYFKRKNAEQEQRIALYEQIQQEYEASMPPVPENSVQYLLSLRQQIHHESNMLSPQDNQAESDVCAGDEDTTNCTDSTVYINADEENADQELESEPDLVNEEKELPGVFGSMSHTPEYQGLLGAVPDPDTGKIQLHTEPSINPVFNEALAREVILINYLCSVEDFQESSADDAVPVAATVTNTTDAVTTSGLNATNGTNGTDINLNSVPSYTVGRLGHYSVQTVLNMIDAYLTLADLPQYQEQPLQETCYRFAFELSLNCPEFSNIIERGRYHYYLYRIALENNNMGSAYWNLRQGLEIVKIIRNRLHLDPENDSRLMAESENTELAIIGKLIEHLEDAERSCLNYEHPSIQAMTSQERYSTMYLPLTDEQIASFWQQPDELLRRLAAKFHFKELNSLSPDATSAVSVPAAASAYSAAPIAATSETQASDQSNKSVVANIFTSTESDHDSSSPNWSLNPTWGLNQDGSTCQANSSRQTDKTGITDCSGQDICIPYNCKAVFYDESLLPLSVFLTVQPEPVLQKTINSDTSSDKTGVQNEPDQYGAVILPPELQQILKRYLTQETYTRLLSRSLVSGKTVPDLEALADLINPAPKQSADTAEAAVSRSTLNETAVNSRPALSWSAFISRYAGLSPNQEVAWIQDNWEIISHNQDSSRHSNPTGRHCEQELSVNQTAPAGSKSQATPGTAHKVDVYQGISPATAVFDHNSITQIEDTANSSWKQDMELQQVLKNNWLMEQELEPGQFPTGNAATDADVNAGTFASAAAAADTDAAAAAADAQGFCNRAAETLVHQIHSTQSELEQMFAHYRKEHSATELKLSEYAIKELLLLQHLPEARKQLYLKSLHQHHDSFVSDCSFDYLGTTFRGFALQLTLQDDMTGHDYELIICPQLLNHRLLSLPEAQPLLHRREVMSCHHAVACLMRRCDWNLVHITPADGTAESSIAADTADNASSAFKADNKRKHRAGNIQNKSHFLLNPFNRLKPLGRFFSTRWYQPHPPIEQAIPSSGQVEPEPGSAPKLLLDEQPSPDLQEAVPVGCAALRAFTLQLEVITTLYDEPAAVIDDSAGQILDGDWIRFHLLHHIPFTPAALFHLSCIPNARLEQRLDLENNLKALEQLHMQEMRYTETERIKAEQLRREERYWLFTSGLNRFNLPDVELLSCPRLLLAEYQNIMQRLVSYLCFHARSSTELQALPLARLPGGRMFTATLLSWPRALLSLPDNDTGTLQQRRDFQHLGKSMALFTYIKEHDYEAGMISEIFAVPDLIEPGTVFMHNSQAEKINSCAARKTLERAISFNSQYETCTRLLVELKHEVDPGHNLDTYLSPEQKAAEQERMNHPYLDDLFDRYDLQIKQMAAAQDRRLLSRNHIEPALARIYGMSEATSFSAHAPQVCPTLHDFISQELLIPIPLPATTAAAAVPTAAAAAAPAAAEQRQPFTEGPGLVPYPELENVLQELLPNHQDNRIDNPGEPDDTIVLPPDLCSCYDQLLQEEEEENKGKAAKTVSEARIQEQTRHLSLWRSKARQALRQLRHGAWSNKSSPYVHGRDDVEVYHKQPTCEYLWGSYYAPTSKLDSLVIFIETRPVFCTDLFQGKALRCPPDEINDWRLILPDLAQDITPDNVYLLDHYIRNYFIPSGLSSALPERQVDIARNRYLESFVPDYPHTLQ